MIILERDGKLQCDRAIYWPTVRLVRGLRTSLQAIGRWLWMAATLLATETAVDTRWHTTTGCRCSEQSCMFTPHLETYY
jgi:hypothetical protein